MMVKDEARVLFSPTQLSEIIKEYPEHTFIVQSSTQRAFKDDEYSQLGIEVVNDISFADLFLGIKQVPLDQLIPYKKYFFFSHTTKRQPHNKWYLEGLQKANITFFDYENLVDAKGYRLVAFGNIAGQLGAYHGLRTYGLKNDLFQLNKPIPNQHIENLVFQAKTHSYTNCKVVITGKGNVGQGAAHFLESIGFTALAPNDFLSSKESKPIFTVLAKENYLKNDNGTFEKEAFINRPHTYNSYFFEFAKKANLYMVGHYYHEGMPLLLTQEQLSNSSLNINTIADISCDVHAPLPTCLRPSTSDAPIYGYHKNNYAECDFKDPKAIAVMAIDNLPSELPKRSSIQFGQQFKEHILPLLINDVSNPILQKANILDQGKFSTHFQYLKDFLNA